MPRVAFVFPGQGSQAVGMVQDVVATYPEAATVFDRANSALGFDLSKIIFFGPEARLNMTSITQPAVLVASVAIMAVLGKYGGFQPSLVAGHSLGEYTALVAAGVLELEDAVLLVHRRGQYMEEAVPPGRGGMMAVLGLSHDRLRQVLEEVQSSGTVDVANINCPGQIVLAGEQKALTRIEDLCRNSGAKKVVRLQVSGPFHCRLMQPAASRLRSLLKQVNFKSPALPLVCNVNAAILEDQVEMKEALVEQLTSPVLWELSVIRMIEAGIDLFVEIGPGQVLTGLIRKINRSVQILNISDAEALKNALAL